MSDLWTESRGHGRDLLVVLHGLGATAAVWTPLLDGYGGRSLAIDLPGHGLSPALDDYAIGHVASAIGAAIASHLQNGGQLVVLGHSFGGAVALALASGWFGVMPTRVFALGVKTVWNNEELARMDNLAARPAAVFESEDDARARYLKGVGLSAVVTPDSPAGMRGIGKTAEGWRLSMDQKAFRVGVPPVASFIAAAECPIQAARGGSDAMVSLDDLKRYFPDAQDIGHLGHNVMTEAPDDVRAWAGLNPRQP